MELISCEFFRRSHFVKSVRIWSVSCLYFPAFGMNKERYSVSLHSVWIQKNTDQKNSKYEQLSHSFPVTHFWLSCSIFDGPDFMKVFSKVYFWTVFNKFFIPAAYLMNTISCDLSPKVQFLIFRTKILDLLNRNS